MKNCDKSCENSSGMEAGGSPRERLTDILTKRYKYEVSLIHICVITEDEQRIKVSVHQTITVEQLLVLIRKIIGAKQSILDWISLNQQHRCELDRDKCLRDFDIKDGSKLYYGYGV